MKLFTIKIHEYGAAVVLLLLKLCIVVGLTLLYNSIRATAAVVAEAARHMNE